MQGQTRAAFVTCLCAAFEVAKAYVFHNLVLLIISASSLPKGKDLKIIGGIFVVATIPNFITYLPRDGFHPDPVRNCSASLGAQMDDLRAFNAQNTVARAPHRLSYSSRSAQHAWVAR